MVASAQTLSVNLVEHEHASFEMFGEAKRYTDKPNYSWIGDLGVGEGERERSWAQKGKGKAPRDHPGPQRKSPTTNPGQKGKGKRPAITH